MPTLDVSGESPEKMTLTLTWDDLDWMCEVLEFYCTCHPSKSYPYQPFVAEIKDFLDDTASTWDDDNN